MSVSILKQYKSIRKEKLSDTARDILDKMAEATNNFKDYTATKKIRPKFEAFYAKIKASKPEAIKGYKAPKSTSKNDDQKKARRNRYKEAAERRKSQGGVPKSMADVKKDAKRPAISIKGKRTSKNGNIYYEYRDNRWDARPQKYPKLADGGMMAKGGEVDYSSLVLKYEFPKYKNKPSFTNYYKVDTSKTILVGGRSEKGYELIFEDGRKSNVVIPEWELRELVNGYSKEIESSGAKVSIAHGGMMAKGGEIKVGDKVKYKNAKYHATVIEVFDDVEIPYATIEYSDGKIKKAYLDDLQKVTLGIAPEYVNPNYMADGGELGREGFTITEMREELKKRFPYSFSFEVNAIKKGTNIQPDYDVAGYGGYKDKDIKGKLYFPQYKRDHQINYEITQGDENTYFHFLLEDSEGNYYSGGFGFKDRGDVQSEYITSFIAFLQEAYGLPFQIKHEIMADGGMMAKGGEVKFDYELKVQPDFKYKNIANRWLEDNSKDSLKYKLAILILREKHNPDEILGIKDDNQYARLLRSLEKAKGSSDHEMQWSTENYSLAEAEKWTKDSLREMFYVHGETMADGGMMAKGGYVNQYFGKGYENDAIQELRKALPNHTFEKGNNRIIVDGGKFVIFTDIGRYGFIKVYGNEGSEGGIGIERLSEAIDVIEGKNFYADGGMMAKGGSIKDTDIVEGKTFTLANGQEIHIKRLFIENQDENWVEYTRDGKSHENRVKELRLFINRWKMSHGGYMADGGMMADGGHLGEPHKLDEFENGGEISEQNTQMLMSLNHQIEHHAKEIGEILTDETPVMAWVLAKAERAASDLSDIAHFLDGQKADHTE